MDWPIPPEQVRDAFSKVPRPLREFIVEGELAQVTQKIAQEHKLHVDTTGLLSQLLTLVLLGFLDPSTLPGELAKLGILSRDIPDFIKELNSQVFIPLQKKVREGGPESTKEERVREGGGSQLSVPASVPSSPAAFRTTAPAPEVAPLSIKPEAHTAMSASIPSEETPSINLIRPKQVTPVSQSESMVPSTLARPVAPVPTMRTMQHDMELVQHGSMPTPYPVAAPQLHPTQATPARTFQTASVPVNVSAARPQSIPGIIHVVPDTARQPSPQVLQTASSKEYTSDPYREAI